MHEMNKLLRQRYGQDLSTLSQQQQSLARELPHAVAEPGASTGVDAGDEDGDQVGGREDGVLPSHLVWEWEEVSGWLIKSKKWRAFSAEASSKLDRAASDATVVVMLERGGPDGADVEVRLNHPMQMIEKCRVSS